TTDVQHLRVYVGHQSLPYGSNVLGRSRNINRIIQHEDFQPNVPENVTDPQTGRTSTIQRHHHDLALIELVDALVFTNSLRPVCLPEQEDNLETNDCWVSGWGETSIQSDDVNEHLQEVSGVMESARTCSQRWGANFTDGIVCFSSGGSGPCKGDSGGGMTCTQGDDRSVLTGIISWGRDDCVHDEHPSVLTRVGAYLPWIHNHIDL
ncbi:CTRL-like protein, partial [Mya arenaria]